MSRLLKSRLILIVLLLGMFVGVGTAVAQTDNELDLSLRRDFGTGIGNNPQLHLWQHSRAHHALHCDPHHHYCHWRAVPQFVDCQPGAQR